MFANATLYRTTHKLPARTSAVIMITSTSDCVRRAAVPGHCDRLIDLQHCYFLGEDERRNLQSRECEQVVGARTSGLHWSKSRIQTSLAFTPPPVDWVRHGRSFYMFRILTKSVTAVPLFNRQAAGAGPTEQWSATYPLVSLREVQLTARSFCAWCSRRTLHGMPSVCAWHG